MDIEEEIARALREEMKHDGDFDPDYDYTEDSERYTAALAPLLDRVRAEAQAEALRQAASDLPASEMVRYRFGTNPQVEFAGSANAWLRDRADRIEQNSEGNET